MAVDLGLDAMNSVGERLLIEAVWPGRMGLHWRLSRAPKLSPAIRRERI
jgi:hypothetical protein